MPKKQGGARPGAGRKKLFDDPVTVGVTFPREWLSFIPKEKRGEWLREAISYKLRQDFSSDIIKASL